MSSLGVSFFMPQPENNRPGIAEVKTLADNTHHSRVPLFVRMIYRPHNFFDDGGQFEEKMA